MKRRGTTRFSGRERAAEPQGTESRTSKKTASRRHAARVQIAVAVFLLAASFAAVCFIGRYPLTFSDMVQAFCGAHSTAAGVFLNIRLPRAAFSALCGAALALSGLLYQELFSNPLASPDVLGVSGGAAVGAAGAMLAGATAAGVRIWSLIGGLAAVLITVFLARLIGKWRAAALILAGVVVKAMADSVLMAFKYTADPEGTLAAIEYRLMGSLQNVRAGDFTACLPAVVLPLAVLYVIRRKIELLSLGDSQARSLGVPAAALRLICIAAATVPAAVMVSVTGIISWAGLIVPHAVRVLTRGSFSKSYALCGICGAIFLLWTDAAARSLTAAEIPVSILTSLAGAVFLAVFLLFSARHQR